MTLSAGQVSLGVKPDTKGFGSDLHNKIMGDSGISGAGKAVGGMLLKGIALAGLGAGIGSILKDSINNASDLNEAGTAITAVFGSADKTIQKFAAGAAATLGQSTNQALAAAQTFGVFGKAAGLTGEDLAGFSTQFVGLAGDLASFNNTTPEQAIQALGAGLRGESEPLRQYGILLDDASLKARASTLGIYSGTGALTSQQKVLAAQAEIMAQTSTQQGDFAKTSGGLANQQRILAAGITNLSTTFGAMLLPAAVAVVGVMNRSLIPVLQAAVPHVQAFGKGIGDAFALIKGSFTGVGADVEMGKLTNPLINFGGLLRTVFDTVKPILESAWATFKPVFDGIGQMFANLAPVFAPLIPQIVSLVTSFSPLSLLMQAMGPIMPSIVGALTDLGSALGGALALVLPALVGLFGTLASTLSGVFATILPVVVSLITTLAGVFVSILPTISNLAGVLAGALGAILPVIAILISALVPIFAALLPPIMQVVGVLVTALGPILTIIINLFAGLVQFLVPVLIPVIQFLGAVFTIVFQAIAAVVTWLVGAITIGFYAVGAIFTWLWGNIIQPVVTFINGAIRTVGDVIGSVFGAISGVIGGAFSGVVGIVKGIINTIIGLVNGVIGNINGIAGAVKAATGGAIDIQLGNIPKLAEGGIVPATPGGRLVRVAEGGQDEIIGPLDKVRATLGADGSGKGDTYNIYEAISARATAMQVSRRQNALGAV